MSLTKCKECGAEISTEAKTCPKCGAKPPRRIGLISILLLCIVGFSAYRLATPSSQTSAGSSGGSPIVAASPVPSPIRSWVYRSTDDDLTGKSINFATVDSMNTEDLHWPYGKGIGAQLAIRKHPRFGRSIYMSIDKGQILCRNYAPCVVTVRFDQRPPVTFTGVGADDGSTTHVFFRNPSRFEKELRTSRTTLIEIPLYQDGSRSWSFSTENFRPEALK